MTNASIIIGMKPSGAYKAYFWGRADAHISDWRGTNYRIAPVDGQPSRGFKTYKDETSLTYDPGHNVIRTFYLALREFVFAPV